MCFNIFLVVASASEGLNVFIHVIKVVVNLLHPVGFCSVGPEDEFVLVVHVLHVLVVALVETLLLLFDGVLQPAAMIPNLQFATRHHKECLDIILQATTLAAWEGVEPAGGSTKLSLLALLHHQVVFARLAAVLIKENGTSSVLLQLCLRSRPVAVAAIDKTKRIEGGHCSQKKSEKLHVGRSLQVEKGDRLARSTWAPLPM